MFSIRQIRSANAPGPRRLPAALAVVALLSAFALPVPAAAQPGPAMFDGAPLAAVFQWLEGLLDGFAPASEAPDGPKAMALPEGCGVDPDGSLCPAPLAQPEATRFESSPGREVRATP